MSMTVSNAPKPRRPGRPPQTDEEQARARQNIVRATSLVFAEYGYHGISVARILEHAGIARPTFYRYFRNSDEPLRMALDEVGRALRDRVVADVTAAEGDIPKVVAAIDGYLWWSGENRGMLRSLYAGIHDPASPVSVQRPNTPARHGRAAVPRVRAGRAAAAGALGARRLRQRRRVHLLPALPARPRRPRRTSPTRAR